MVRTPMAALPIIAVLFVCIPLVSCVENPPFPFDPYDRPLALRQLEPSPENGVVARDQSFRLQFNTYLNTEPLTFFNTLTLSTGSARVSGRTRYEMVDRQIIWTPRQRMISGLFYELTLNTEVLASVTGQPYQGPEFATIAAGDFLQEEPPAPEPAPTWDDVEPLFVACNGCHEDPEWMLSPMTYEGLVGQPSTQRDALLLVRPYDAPNSYLMHKILWDYPVREGQAQPPAWAGYQQLSRDAQRLVERWIANGALKAPPP